MSSSSNVDPNTRIIEMLNIMSQRLDAIEARTNGINPPRTTTTNSAAPEARATSPAQHGNRAEGLWRDREYELSKKNYENCV